jgi:hypothetical protein
MNLKCPACKGPIALWAVRPEFTCHHCRMILGSNSATIGKKYLPIACTFEMIIIFSLYWALDSGAFILITGLLSACPFFLVIFFASKYHLKLTPIRRTPNSIKTD